jgi:hypothetical protein
MNRRTWTSLRASRITLAVVLRNLPPDSLACLEQRLYRGSEFWPTSASSAARTANTFIFARPMTSRDS